MPKINNLYFTNGLVVHVNETSNGSYYYATAFATPTDPSKYPYHYKIKPNITQKIENGGSYNTHYFKSITEMIKTVKRISGEKLIKKTYYQ